jgi:hypothetical protein
MDQITFDEIVGVLAMFGRPDLIADFKDNVKVDEDYKPPKYVRKDKYSESEGSASSESDYEVEEDENGFCSLK